MSGVAPGIAVCSFLAAALAGQTAYSAPPASLSPELHALYVDLHQTPELSLHEEKTAAKMARQLRRLGFEVTERVGATGVVGVLRNGAGPAVMLRTELDALPVEEKTGLPFASHVRTRNDDGVEVPVMHACGHDVHMTCWVGTAEAMAESRAQWRGTLVFIAQPAEERGMGARAMLADGLFSRFPKPDFVLALHDTPTLATGTVGYTAGPAFSSADSVDLTIYGKGGHGAHPEATVDPIVIAARTVLALQTLVSRENDPLDPAIVTVGSFHGGSKHNIIPDEVKLQITVRAFREAVRKRLLSGIERIAKAEAAASAAPRSPEMKIVDVSSAVTVNNPALTGRVAAALRRRFGESRVIEMPRDTVSEDFSEYSLAGVPAVIFRLGATEPQRFARARASGENLPSLHSSFFAPDADAAIRTGIEAETAALRDLLGRP
ncbi:MAG: amidohydrolase [Thermoanaerobaculia bacterium]